MKRSIVCIGVVMAAILIFSGCAYMKNRYYDFRDTFDVEAGATFAKPQKGAEYIMPHSLGLYLEATQYMQMGALYFNNMDIEGATAGLDLRSSWAGKETRTRYGFGPWQKYVINQNGYQDKYKSTTYSKEAIDLCYRDNIMQGIWRTVPFFRGRNYWEYFGAEVALCEPLLTHFGIKFHAGFDPCQMMDFVLGWTTLDIYGDDLEKD